MATTEKKKEVNEATATARLTLGERLVWMTAQLDPITATGKDRFKNTALSIEDVEDALRPLFAQAGVVTRWSMRQHDRFDEGNQQMWGVYLTIHLSCDDDREDSTLDEWYDIGTSPTAAASFAVKSYYRRLFHLASADEEQAGQRPARQTRQANGSDYADVDRTTHAQPVGLTDEQVDELNALAEEAGVDPSKLAAAIADKISFASLKARLERDIARKASPETTAAEPEPSAAPEVAADPPARTTRRTRTRADADVTPASTEPDGGLPY